MKAFLVASLLALGVSADIQLFYLDTLLPARGRIEDTDSGKVGLTVADQICLDSAGKNFVAAMGDPHTQFKHRFAENEPIVRSDSAVLGANRDDIFTSINVPILSKSGVSPDATDRVYTGSGPEGLGFGANCNGWQSISALNRGEVGIPSSTTQWFRSQEVVCNVPNVGGAFDPHYALYCVEQNKVACIFATSVPVDLSVYQGKDGLDRYCQETFSQGKSTTTQFAALVSTTDRDAIDVFPEEEGSYMLINTEGNIVQTLQYELFRSGTLFENNILTLERTLPAETRVWSGSKNEVQSIESDSEYGVFSGLTDNCLNWGEDLMGVPLEVVSGIHGDVAYTDNRVAIDGKVTCNEMLNLICVQTTALTTSTVHGDPHFAGFDGSRYNFDGVNGEIFNIISDSGFLLNAEFTEMEIFETHGTWMTKLGFRSGKDTIVFDPVFGLLINNDELVKSGEHFTTDEFEVEIQWKNKRPSNIVVRATGYEVSIKPVQYEPTKIYLDVQVALYITPVKPHGVLGQTAKYLVDGSKPNPVNSKAKNAEDLLEGTFTDYLVKDGILGTDFTFNTFEGLVSGRGHIQTRNYIVARSSFVPISWKENF